MWTKVDSILLDAQTSGKGGDAFPYVLGNLSANYPADC
jgi:hypothetical protein